MKEEALGRGLCRTRFGREYGLVIRQATLFNNNVACLMTSPYYYYYYYYHHHHHHHHHPQYLLNAEYLHLYS